jgi:hypothetical protein
MNWGSKRKFVILGSIWTVVIIIAAFFVYNKFFNKEPNCFDNILNQDERGVDCGGVCALLCPDESRAPIVVYNRLFKAGPGAYTALALVENPNQNVYSKYMSYVFKVYDPRNILLFEVSGRTFVPPGRIFPIFEHSILTGNREAQKITFEIIENDIPWEKGVYNDPDIRIINVSHEGKDTRSRITAQIENNEVYPLRNVEVVAVVYDMEGNAHEASATIVDYISPNDKASLSFTWNYKFDFDISKINIIPRVVPRDWE